MAYRKLSEPPHDLKVLLEAFNALPAFKADREARAFRLAAAITSEFAKEGVKLLRNEPISTEFPHLKNQRAELYRLLGPEITAALRTDYLFTLKWEIELLEIEQFALIGIVLAYWEEDRSQPFTLTYQEANGGLAIPFQFRPDGTLTTALKVLEVFGRMSPERVRLCKICDKIFWARKSNAWTCSPEHATELGNKKRSKKMKLAEVI